MRGKTTDQIVAGILAIIFALVVVGCAITAILVGLGTIQPIGLP